MNEASYRACIKSLWAVAEHLHAIDLDELWECAEVHGTEEECHLVRLLQRVSPHIPRPPAHRR